jgi:hypothetical protein
MAIAPIYVTKHWMNRELEKKTTTQLIVTRVCLEEKLQDIERFYPWPALAASFQADIKEIERILEDRNSVPEAPPAIAPIPFQQTPSPSSDLIPEGHSSWPIRFEAVPLRVKHIFHDYLLKSSLKSVIPFEYLFEDHIYRCDRNDCWTVAHKLEDVIAPPKRERIMETHRRYGKSILAEELARAAEEKKKELHKQMEQALLYNSKPQTIVMDDLTPREQFIIEASSKLVKVFEEIYKADFFKGKFHNP